MTTAIAPWAELAAASAGWRARARAAEPPRRCARRRSRPRSAARSGLPEPGRSRDGELVTRGALVELGERRQHGLAEPALGPVVLDRDDRAGLGAAGAASPRRSA